jgi:hypothetical protein
VDHDEARMLASARADGELETARIAELDEHLAICEPCRAFAAALPQLSVLAAALPREHAPTDLTRRVRAGMAHRTPRATPSRRWRLAPALTAAIVVGLIAVLVGSVPIVRVPRAEAADALTRITSLFIEREITFFDDDGRPSGITREKLWFKAPGLVRSETRTEDGPPILFIERPGMRYREDATGRFLETGLLPSTAPQPEPLTPTIALLGTESGPGPVVLGRPTRRIQLTFEGERRVAFVDASTFAVLGVEESVVLGKETIQGGRLKARKRTLALEYDLDLVDSLFQIPAGARITDHGAKPRPLGSLTAPPAGRLEGLTLVAAASGPQGEAILYAKGAFQVLVEINGFSGAPSPSRSESTRVGRREATLILPLFGLPEVRFQVGGHGVAVRAPLPPQQLLELAEQMYPDDRE